MSFREKVKSRVEKVVFKGNAKTLDDLRSWSLFALTFVLLTVWKGISVLDGVYTVDFWMAVYGADPIADLKVSGLVLLLFYLAGALVWWVVTIFLIRLGKVWMRRLGFIELGANAA